MHLAGLQAISMKHPGTNLKTERLWDREPRAVFVMLYTDKIQEEFEMIVIATPLTQWDTGRSVEIKNIVATHVHFANKGDSHAVIMALENSQAKIPDYLLQSGKELCVYAVSNGVTIERKSFFVTKRERPENYVYKEDQRNFVYKLITDAQEATEAANQATQNANEAADKANQAAKSWVIMGEVKGESVVIDDAIDQTFAGFRIFGKTTQAGTPTPDAPVDMVSVENPTIAVNEQSMLVPYTLRGIPVSSGGTYIDSNGQQWVCDEVDFDRGVYVRRVGFTDLTDAGWTKNDSGKYFAYKSRGVYSDTHRVLCTHIYGGVTANGNRADVIYINSNHDIRLNIVVADDTVETVTNAMNGAILIGVLASFEEKPLSKEELAAYATLHTSRYGTTVSNDAGAYMELEYVMDAKKYIDSLFTGGILPATVE